MKTIIATAALTVMFLSAGAFAGNNHRVVLSVGNMGSNVTVMQKNQAFPVLGPIIVEACLNEDCSEA